MMGPRAGAPQRPLPPCNKLLPCSLTAVVLMATPCTKSLGGGGGGCKHGGEEGREIPNLLHRRRANAGPIVRMSALNVAREEGSGRKCHKKQKKPLTSLKKTSSSNLFSKPSKQPWAVASLATGHRGCLWLQHRCDWARVPSFVPTIVGSG